MFSSVDPNWLYSSTAQSTAALVAIIGGFIVSRVIALSSDQEGFIRRMQEVVALRAVALEEKNLTDSQVYATAYEWFREHRLQSLIESGNDPEDAYVPRGASDEDEERMRTALLQEIASVKQLMESHYPSPSAPPSELAQLKADGLPVDDFHEDVVVAVARYTADGRRRGTTLAALLRGSGNSLSLLPKNDRIYARHDAAIARRDELCSRIRSLEAEATLIQHELTLLGNPRGLRAAFGVLLGFAAVGILLPLSVMACRPVPDSFVVRWTVVGCFAAGILALFGYMVYLVRILRSGRGLRAPDIRSD